MKTKKMFIVVVILMAITTNVSAQIVHEATFGDTYGPSSFSIIHFANSGDKYVWLSPSDPNIASTVVLYNMDRTIWKSISMGSIPASTVLIEFTSENLFSTEGVDILFECYSGNTGLLSTYIMHENGEITFYADGFETRRSDGSPVLFNADGGVKMILYGSDFGPHQGEAWVYSLPGSTVNVPRLPGKNIGSLKIFPNPVSENYINIQYSLPDGINSGQIVLYNLLGQQIKSYPVDRTFQDIEIKTSDFPAGNYMWQLQASNYKTTQKMVVIK